MHLVLSCLPVVIVVVLCVPMSSNAYTRPTYCKKPFRRGNVSSFLWSIRRPNSADSPVSYFFGSIHVPYVRVWDHVNPVVKTAFQKSHSLFFELDLNNPETLHALSACQMLDDNQTLENLVPSSLYQRLHQHLLQVKSQMPRWIGGESHYRKAHSDYFFNSVAGDWQRKRPIWLMLLLNSLTPDEIKQRGLPVLDLYLAQRAQAVGKPTGAIERVDEQCGPLNKLNMSQVIFALNQTLLRHERFLSDPYAADRHQWSSTEDLIQHYNCGDLNEDIFNKDTVQFLEFFDAANRSQVAMETVNIDQYFRSELLSRRNHRMAKRTLHLLNTHPSRSFFFAYGAGHFFGSDSIIALVREAGFIVEPVRPRFHAKTLKFRRHHRKLGRDGVPARRRLLKLNRFTSLVKSGNGQTNSSTDADFRSRQTNRRLPFRSGDVVTSTSTKNKKMTTSKDRPFNELWVRIEGYSPKPWQDILQTVEMTTESAPSVQYHYYYIWHKASSSSSSFAAGSVLQTSKLYFAWLWSLSLIFLFCLS